MNCEELETCIKTYGRDIYSFCCQLTHSRQEADDLYQDTFLKLTELRERVDIYSNPKSYILAVAVNLWKNRRRKSAWRQRIAGIEVSMDDQTWDLASTEATMEEQAVAREQERLVRHAVAALPDKYRMPILLFYMEELKLSEISSVLGIPEGTVKSRLHKAKKMLEKELEVVLR